MHPGSWQYLIAGCWRARQCTVAFPSSSSLASHSLPIAPHARRGEGSFLSLHNYLLMNTHKLLRPTISLLFQSIPGNIRAVFIYGFKLAKASAPAPPTTQHQCPICLKLATRQSQKNSLGISCGTQGLHNSRDLDVSYVLVTQGTCLPSSIV